MKHRHTATPDTQGRLYEYCECGAVRRQTPKGYDDWHVCDSCRITLDGGDGETLDAFMRRA